MLITHSVSANVALTVAQTVTNIAGTPEKHNKKNIYYNIIDTITSLYGNTLDHKIKVHGEPG